MAEGDQAAVRAELEVEGNDELIDDMLDVEDALDLELEDDDDDEDDDEPEPRADLSEARRILVEAGAPWSGVPLWIARNKIAKDRSWDMDVIFPEVYAEDRSSKLKDLATAQAVGAVTHRRMAEQMAKELGFDDYDYESELRAIEQEQETLPKGILGVSDNLGAAALGPAVSGKSRGGMGGGGSFSIGAPGPGVTSEQPELYPRRYDLSGTATARFRKLQRRSAS